MINNKKTKIIHVTSVHNHNDVRIYEKECISLSKEYNVEIINPNFEGKINKINFKKIFFFRKSKILRVLTSWIFVLPSTCLGKHKLIHFHDPELIFAAPFWKLFRKKVVYDVHENYSKQILANESLPEIVKIIISKILLFIEAIYSIFFDLIIVVLKDLNPTLNRFNNKVVVNNKPIIDYIFAPKKRKNQACYFGVISEKRGVLKVAKILKEKGIKLIIGGNFDNEHIKNEICKLDNVRYIGFVEREKIIEVVSESKCGLCTLMPTQNHVNGSPTKFFEYLAYGTPVIASNFKSYINEVSSDNDFVFYVNPLDSDEIRKSLLSIFKMSDSAINNLGLSAHLFSKKHHGWEKEEIKLLNAYKTII
ncbi:MAG: hypothetical protein CBD97_01330 [Pelagibacteraceae bacterium TMED237]|nr:MAG: hypothetical protein CBD97_01330 [Pelagibacteraceae bacterium TMED237]|tara:strand:+ start:13129 stop:14220 length:1092 start_codon:yes stop_codon:yes gene_type:complete